MKAIVWSKPVCPYCVTAKAMLTRMNCEIEERIIGQEYTKEDLLKEIPDAKTVPQIILDGQYIGGYTELLTHFENLRKEKSNNTTETE